MSLRKMVVLAGLALAFNAQADRLDQMISPAFHPVTFEDPRISTEARFLFVNHNLSDKFVTSGGDVQVYALQLRYALSDDLAIIATKDGFVDFNPDAALPKETGLADVEAGLKYTLFKDAAAGQIVSAQLRYLFPLGDDEVLQGKGDGSIHPSISAAFSLCPQSTLTVGTGMRIPMDTDDSMFWDFDAQWDYRIDMDGWALYPLIGASVIHVMDGGDRLGIADEGQDFFNFGATESTGKSISSAVAGLRVRPWENVDLGATFQFPIDAGTGTRVLESRWTFDVIVRL